MPRESCSVDEQAKILTFFQSWEVAVLHDFIQMLNWNLNYYDIQTALDMALYASFQKII